MSDLSNYAMGGVGGGNNSFAPSLATNKQTVNGAMELLDGAFNRLESLIEVARSIADRVNGSGPKSVPSNSKDVPEGSLIASATARVRRANHIGDDLERELEQIQKGLWS